MGRSNRTSINASLCGLGLLAMLGGLGCTSDYAGQTLPSPYWLKDDIQYFPPGPEFKLSREAAAMKTYGSGRGARGAPAPLGPPPGAPAPGGNLEAGAGVQPAPGGVAPAPGVVEGVPPAGAPPADIPADEGAADANEADPFK